VAFDGCDDGWLSFLPVAGDDVALDGEEGVVCDVVEVAEPEQARGDGAVGVLGLVAGEVEGEAQNEPSECLAGFHAHFQDRLTRHT
jgi:hypothetical protein